MVSRRHIIFGTGMLLLQPQAARAQGSTVAAAGKEPQDAWMEQLLQPGSTTKGANGGLFVGKFADRTYFTIGPIGWSPEGDQADRLEAVTVPTGFVTDFASIPRLFWSILPPDGSYCYAAIIHDYLYWDQSLPRQKADDTLKACMEDFKVDPATIATIYGGVRLGGAAAWQANATLKANGERRRLKIVPDDPRVRWSEWKTRPEVF